MTQIARPELDQYVPHKGRIFLLDRVVGRGQDEAWLESEVDIHSGCLFFDPERQGVPAWVAFEYMAQSIAALSGFVAKETNGAEPKIGFILAVRDFVAQQAYFPSGTTISIRVKQIFKDGNLVSFDCLLRSGPNQLVSSVINAIEVDESSLESMMGEQHV